MSLDKQEVQQVLTEFEDRMACVRDVGGVSAFELVNRGAEIPAGWVVDPYSCHAVPEWWAYETPRKRRDRVPKTMKMPPAGEGFDALVRAYEIYLQAESVLHTIADAKRRGVLSYLKKQQRHIDLTDSIYYRAMRASVADGMVARLEACGYADFANAVRAIVREGQPKCVVLTFPARDGGRDMCEGRRERRGAREGSAQASVYLAASVPPPKQMG